MRKILASVIGILCFRLLGLNADVPLEHLVEYDKQTCIEVLQAASLPELWDCFLKGQANFYFTQEAKWLSQMSNWKKARDILELGSGNGVYLSRLSETFKEKTFFGVEQQTSLVEQSNAQFAHPGLAFIEGDAEISYEQYKNQFDAVLYRLTLQHLKNPKLSLELAHQYLKKEGCVFIIDSYDPARVGSRMLPSCQEAIRQYNEGNRGTLRGNRRITMEILEDLHTKNNSLSNLYKVVYTSVDIQGNCLETGIRLASEQDRQRYFNHTMLLLSILRNEYGVEVDLSEAYNELKVCLENKKSLISPGIHFLVLKKIGN